MPTMNTHAHSHPTVLPRPWPCTATLASLALTLGISLHADIVVDANVTPRPGSFLYDITVTNNETDDLAIVSFSDAPENDPLIDPSLIVPIGFVGSYDGVLQFLDFLSDTSVFAAGSTVGGFQFESLSGPGQFFRRIEGLTVNGIPVSGFVQTTVVPEAGSMGAAAAFAGIAVAYGFRRARSTGSPAKTPPCTTP